MPIEEEMCRVPDMVEMGGEKKLICLVKLDFLLLEEWSNILTDRRRWSATDIRELRVIA